ncbi:MAG: hypothetical protein HY609_06305 [Deltaproteobacteria bacterium]|nr:hypothetical protein [Deltaproteobacteria bacterium]
MLILYFSASLCYLSLFLRGRKGLHAAAAVLTGFGALLHAVYLGFLYAQNQLSPLAVLSLGIVLLFFGLTRLKPWQGLGSLFLPPALILFIFSLSERIAFTGLITVHILLAVATLVLLIGNLVLGLSFWIQGWSLKQKKWEALSWRLPPLLLNEKWASLFLRLGFVFLTLVLISGAFLRLEVTPAHILLALAAWGFYGWMVPKRAGTLSGRKMVLLSGLGFVSLWIAYLWN